MVQSAEEEWPKKIAVNTAAPAKTTVNFLGQKPVPLPEPAFTLDEIEKEDAGQLEQDNRVAEEFDAKQFVGQQLGQAS